MRRTSLAMLVALLAGGLAAGPATADGKRGRGCEANARAALADVGISAGDIREFKISVQSTTNSQGNRKTTGYFAWTKIKQCGKGSVVVSMTPQCKPVSVYTRSGCQVAGLEDC